MGNSLSFQNDFVLILIGALIFTASFLWKDFFSDVEELYFPKSHGLAMRFVFVVIISLLLVSSSVGLRNYFHINQNQIQPPGPIQFDDAPID